MSAPIPVTIIGGYLGAGKTTLVNHLLRNSGGRRLAVLVNEFGELPIDEDLIIDESGDGFISIAGGCICCSYGSDLIETLSELPKLASPPDQIVIEASGVALPDSVAGSVSLIPDFRIDGVVVLADATDVIERGADRYMSDTITRQLNAAGLLMVSKLALVDNARAEEVRAWVQEHSPTAALIESRPSDVSVDVVLGLHGDRWVEASEGALEHDTSVYETHHWHIHAPVSIAELRQVFSVPIPGLLRAKGFMHNEHEVLTTVQYAGQRFESEPAPEGAKAGFVCIGLSNALKLDSINAVLGPPGHQH